MRPRATDLVAGAGLWISNRVAASSLLGCADAAANALCLIGGAPAGAPAHPARGQGGAATVPLPSRAGIPGVLGCPNPVSGR
jgi:hypothetical protein